VIFFPVSIHRCCGGSYLATGLALRPTRKIRTPTTAHTNLPIRPTSHETAADNPRALRQPV